jgi:hypothetical protein
MEPLKMEAAFSKLGVYSDVCGQSPRAVTHEDFYFQHHQAEERRSIPTTAILLLSKNKEGVVPVLPSTRTADKAPKTVGFSLTIMQSQSPTKADLESRPLHLGRR